MNTRPEAARNTLLSVAVIQKRIHSIAHVGLIGRLTCMTRIIIYRRFVSDNRESDEDLQCRDYYTVKFAKAINAYSNSHPLALNDSRMYADVTPGSWRFGC